MSDDRVYLHGRWFLLAENVRLPLPTPDHQAQIVRVLTMTRKLREAHLAQLHTLTRLEHTVLLKLELDAPETTDRPIASEPGDEG